jgi:nucleoside-diphosphate-sugar epimerase
MRVLIAGCGYVGSELARRLGAEGDDVFGLRRRPEGLPPGVKAIAADLSDSATLRGLPDDLDAVVYAASADAFDDGAYRAAYVDGLRNLLGALAESGGRPGRVLYASSTAVYAQNAGEWVDESSETEPRSFSGQRVLEGERVLLGAGVPGTVLRLGGIYGPGRTRLVESVRSGRAVVRAGEPHYTNRIHRDDAAGALAHLLRLPAPLPVYLGVDREPADEALVLRWLADRLGVTPPPVEPAEPLATGREDAAGARRPRGSKRCANDRLLASGYRFLWPTFREGYGALIAAGSHERSAG